MEQEVNKTITVNESMILQNPQNKNSIKKLIGLYSKIGEMHKANELIQVISEI